jgi:hypothetical protein
VVRLLQRVVATVLAVLAPVLAIGLLLFVLALPFTGLQALWEATRDDAAAARLRGGGADPGQCGDRQHGGSGVERRYPLLRYGAMALAAVMLPLAVLAAVATGLRIGQYGFTPERLWALDLRGVACCLWAAYFVSLARGGWAGRLVRPANLMLAFGSACVGLVLATPLISFNAISTRDQVARLESGKIGGDKFDWRALAFDFGKPGATHLKRLQALRRRHAIGPRAIDTEKAESATI